MADCSALGVKGLIDLSSHRVGIGLLWCKLGKGLADQVCKVVYRSVTLNTGVAYTGKGGPDSREQLSGLGWVGSVVSEFVGHGNIGWVGSLVSEFVGYDNIGWVGSLVSL